MKNIFFILIASVLMSASCGEATSELVVISTEFGDMKVKLYDETPQHKANFLKLVDEGFYDGTLFHRVIEGFMIQGGDPNSIDAPAGAPLGNGGPGYTIPAEFNPALIHKKGALSAARLGDGANPKKASSGSQFYVVQGQVQRESDLGSNYTDEQKEIYTTIGGTPFLDRNYTVFGEVVEGLDVIDKIAAVQKDGRDRPLKDVKMTLKRAK